MTNTASAACTVPATQSQVIPSEVGWQFVPQYYTFVNKQPNRLHCFYTKNSTFIHGTEGEDGKPCFGQQEIHNKILSIGFQDCKVFIHSVDAQASANNGIIIQVIGEMSNKGDAWRKFVQTFFLAEQPNGYFVLNDIFRFLKEESVESEQGSDAGLESEPSLPAPVEHAPDSAAQASVPPTVPVLVELSSQGAPVPELSTSDPQQAQLNGFSHSEPDSIPSSVEAPTSSIESHSPDPEPGVTAETDHPSPTPPTTPPPAVSSTLPVQQAHPPAIQTPLIPASVAPVLKSWATLAATDSKKWGAAVAQESRGTSEAVAPIISNPSAPPSRTQTPVTSGARQNQVPPQGRADREQHPAYIAANAVTTPQCFVKGVVETVSSQALNQILTQRFGAIKELEFVRSKACAFLEFATLESAKRAIIASLPVSQGGEGGIRIEVGAETGPVRISIDTRKERGERPPPRGGGGPPNGDSRGSYRGRGGGGGRGRAAPPPGK